jgi:NAD(P)-dependent dehydrogenase (short-subunit alcohol dehydrogenase family)
MPIVLITGANRGLGFEFASEYLADGWRVFAACRRPEEASALQKLSKSSGGKLSILEMDVTSGGSVSSAASQFGNGALDVLINCAGVAGKSGQNTGHVDYRDWAHVFDINTMGPLRVLEAFIEHLAKSERKLAVTITSAMGSLADNTYGGYIPYRSSKAAVNMVMRSAAIDLAPRGIICVLLHPGWVRTDMGGPKAPLTAQESVSAMRRLIAAFGPKDSGKFYSYEGREYPW